MSTQFAGRLSLIAFATAAFRGLWAQADFFGTIQTALVSLGVFYVLGLVIGEAARRIVEENAKADLVERSARPRHPELALHKPERMTFQHGGRYGNTGH